MNQEQTSNLYMQPTNFILADNNIFFHVMFLKNN